MTPPSLGLLGPRNYSLAWTLPCGLGRLWALAVSVAPDAGTERGTGVLREIQDSLIAPRKAILPLVFKTLRRGLSPRTTGRSRKSRDPGLRSGTWTVILGSRFLWCSRQSWKAARGRGRDHSLPLPRRYFLGGVEARGQEQRENPRPVLHCVLRRGWWSPGAH